MKPLPKVWMNKDHSVYTIGVYRLEVVEYFVYKAVGSLRNMAGGQLGRSINIHILFLFVGGTCLQVRPPRDVQFI